MKLMYDTDVCQQEVLINESESGKPKYKIRGIFSTIGEMNRNKRVYPRNLWEREVNNYQNIISSGDINSLMEWQHPPRSAVDPMAAVSRINKLFIDGKYVMGEADILDNTQANQIKTLIDNKIKISVSSRALGSVNRDGTVKDFKLITYDVVPDPSDYNATMNGLVENFQLNEGILQDLEFDASGKIVDVNGRVIDNSESRMIDNFNEMTESELKMVSKHIQEKFQKLISNYK